MPPLEIFSNMSKSNSLFKHNNNNNNNNKIYLEKRIDLLNLIRNINSKLDFNSQTFFLALFYMDKIFLNLPSIITSFDNQNSNNKLNINDIINDINNDREYVLLSLSCLVIASKFNENDPRVPDLITYLKNCSEITKFQFNYTIDEIRKGEVFVLQCLEYKMNFFTVYHFIVFFFAHGLIFKSSLERTENVNGYSKKKILEKIYIMTREILECLIEDEKNFYVTNYDNNYLTAAVILKFSIENILGIVLRDEENVFKLFYNFDEDDDYLNIKKVVKEIYENKIANNNNVNNNRKKKEIEINNNNFKEEKNFILLSNANNNNNNVNNSTNVNNNNNNNVNISNINNNVDNSNKINIMNNNNNTIENKNFSNNNKLFISPSQKLYLENNDFEDIKFSNKKTKLNINEKINYNNSNLNSIDKKNNNNNHNEIFNRNEKEKNNDFKFITKNLTMHFSSNNSGNKNNQNLFNEFNKNNINNNNNIFKLKLNGIKKDLSQISIRKRASSSSKENNNNNIYNSERLTNLSNYNNTNNNLNNKNNQENNENIFELNFEPKKIFANTSNEILINNNNNIKNLGRNPTDNYKIINQTTHSKTIKDNNFNKHFKADDILVKTKKIFDRTKDQNDEKDFYNNNINNNNNYNNSNTIIINNNIHINNYIDRKNINDIYSNNNNNNNYGLNYDYINISNSNNSNLNNKYYSSKNTFNINKNLNKENNNNNELKDNNQMRYGHFGTYFDYGYEQFLRKGNNNNYFNNYSSNLNNNNNSNLSNYKYNANNNNIYTNYSNNYY